MRKIERVPLTAETADFLWRRRLEVAAAGERRPQERTAAQYQEAERLWKQKKNRAYDEIRRCLREMAPGHEYCMYCEYSHASTIDHYRPMKVYPTRAFEWTNYIWSCSECNGDHKKTQFPLDRNGLPMLIDPTRDDPREHLELAPRTGKLLGLTPRGEKTIDVLGFHHRGNLDKTRAMAWRSVQRLLVLYEEACLREDSARCLEVQRDLCCHPHASVLSALIMTLGRPGGDQLVQEKRCAAILATYPEIHDWV